MNYNTRAGNNLFDVRESVLDVLLLKVANVEQAISKRNDARGKLATLLLRVANFMSVVYYVIEPYKSWQPFVESCKVDNHCEGLVEIYLLLCSILAELSLNYMETTKELRLAVLIDADNIPYSNVKEMMEEIAKYGTPTFKRIYADWTKPHVTGWKNVLLENAITPIQQYSYTSGKNATDSAMIIDAMDILYTGRVDGFCIVSSDSDFTRIATRLREAGMKVFGIGEKKTPLPFISACDKFIYLEILKPVKEVIKNQPPPKDETAVIAKSDTIGAVDQRLIRLIADSINDIADEDGWAFLGNLGSLLLKKQPDFDSRNYGYTKLLPLIKSINKFQIDERKSGKANIKHVYVRTK